MKKLNMIMFFLMSIILEQSQAANYTQYDENEERRIFIQSLNNAMRMNDPRYMQNPEEFRKLVKEDEELAKKSLEMAKLHSNKTNTHTQKEKKEAAPTKTAEQIQQEKIQRDIK